MKVLSKVIAVMFLGCAAVGAMAETVTYTFDTTHSRIAFYVTHYGFSHSLGAFKIAEGSFDFDDADWSFSQVKARVPVKSLDLGDSSWNTHVLAESWLDAARFPWITFTSTKVEGSGAGPGRLAGDLTIKGVTRPVVLDLRLNAQGEHPMRRAPAVGFTGTTTLRRSDFGITSYLGAVGDEIDVRVEIEAYSARF
jgi:polyisoprenoid-binding protein YceI